YDDVGGENQQWQVDESGGYATFVNRFSGKALDVWEWSTEPGDRISQYDPTGSENQQFELVPVGDDGGDDPGGGDPGECGGGSPDATVTGSSGNYTAQHGGSTVYTGGDYRAAIQTAVDALGNGQRVSVMASGSIGGSTIWIPSNRTFEGCGTINAGNNGGRGAIESTNTSNVSIPHLDLTGDPYFGMRFFGNNGLHLGQINLNLDGGIGIRFERDEPASSNVTMDYVYVNGAGNHGVETWNVDGLEIGTVVARNTAYAGLLLNNTRNANIGLVDGDNVASGTGYATFRTANRAGRLADGSYATNIYVDRVVSRGGGRGIFCVSESGGVRIGQVDLAGNGNNAILIENCYNYTIAGGTVDGGGEVRIAARSEFANTRDTDITLTVNNTSVRESPCADNSTWNLSGNASIDIC
ncbi:RICIN domain-containing protein, partial [Glycomyces xiaoerkulensis]|uniref:RICIN domain-containing protein n=1 Tax=Glycomyces xiaoerkulensis TaxID=2038139 RepID=UPI000C25ED6B